MAKAPRYFVQYWLKETFDRVKEEYSRAPFVHTAGELFRKRGTGPGDFVYAWSYSDGKLFLVGRMQAGRFVSQQEADALYKPGAWKATDHLFAKRGTGTPWRFDRAVPHSVIKKLSFVSPNGEIHAPKFVSKDQVDPQTFRGLRELTRASALLLNRLIDSHAADLDFGTPESNAKAATLKEIVSRASSFQAGGESDEHRELKEFVARNPGILQLPPGFTGRTEYPLPSGDSLDVLFKHGEKWIAVEVKSRRSPEADLVRGIFQCIKYRALIEAYQASQGLPQDGRAVLVLEELFPQGLVPLKNMLGVEVLENVTPRLRSGRKRRSS